MMVETKLIWFDLPSLELEAACEWLEEIGQLEKVSAPFKMTKKSRSSVEEPAYFLLDS